MVPGRAAALCQPESGSLQPDVGSGCGDGIIETASSEGRRGHSPQTPRGETPQGGKQHTGKPTRQHCRLPALPHATGSSGFAIALYCCAQLQLAATCYTAAEQQQYTQYTETETEKPSPGSHTTHVPVTRGIVGVGAWVNPGAQGGAHTTAGGTYQHTNT